MEKYTTMYRLTVSCSPSGEMMGSGVHIHRSANGVQYRRSIERGQNEGYRLHIRLKRTEPITTVWVLSSTSKVSLTSLIQVKLPRIPRRDNRRYGCRFTDVYSPGVFCVVH